MTQKRQKIPVKTQVQVLYRDGWLCHWCHRPTVFPLAMKYLGEFVTQHGFKSSPAYYDFRYRRDKAPLLDHLACVMDHVEAYSGGGLDSPDNLVVSCNKCNMIKGNQRHEDFAGNNPSKTVKGKYGEPSSWDGLASLFLVLSQDNPARLTPNERIWRRELEAHIKIITLP